MCLIMVIVGAKVLVNSTVRVAVYDIKIVAYFPVAVVGVHVHDMLTLFVQILLVLVAVKIKNVGAFTNSNSWGLCIKLLTHY